MIVSNSSPLIVLAKISRLSLLEDLFGEVYIPKAVFEELLTKIETLNKVVTIKFESIEQRIPEKITALEL